MPDGLHAGLPPDTELLAAAAALADGGYHRVVTPLEGGGFLVEVAQFGAVVGQGDTLDAAYADAGHALTAAIAVLLEDGDQVPAPLGIATGSPAA